MRLCTIRTSAGTTAARVEAGGLVVLAAPDVGAVLAADAPPVETGEVLARAGARFAPPVVRPGKVIGVGLNYRSHLVELGIPLPQYPTLFGKFASSLLGAEDDLVLPDVTSAAIWEVELAVIMGATVPRGVVSADQAVAAIGGYTVANDVTMRDFQRQGKQWLPGKAFDAATPIGPVVVTPDEFGAERGHPTLRLTCTVDDVTVQDGSTSDLLFPPAELITYIAQFAALEPGDVLLTGTPAGAGPDATVFLQPGQVLTSCVEGIGECRNLVRRGD